MSLALLITIGCTDDTAPSETYRGYFTETEGGMRYDFYQEPDTTVLILNNSKVPCDSTETIEEVPCGDTPIYMGKTYILTLSDTHATLTIGIASQKYDYVSDKRTRQWHYHPGEYDIDLTGYEKYKRMTNVHKAVISTNPMTFKTNISFLRKDGEKEELAFVSNANFTYVEYGPKRMHKVDLPASVEEQNLIVSKDSEYFWTLKGDDVEYQFHIQERQLIQTKPVYKNIGTLSLN